MGTIRAARAWAASSVAAQAPAQRAIRRSLVPQVDDERRVVRRLRALAGVAVDDAPRHPLGHRRGREREVDAHAAVLVEVAGAVVPIGEQAADTVVAAPERVFETPLLERAH